MRIWIFTINTHLRGILEELLYFVLFFTVHSWFCWFKQCGEMLQCPHVVAKWAVKLRGWALWLAGSSLPYINNNIYNKIKTVTKCSHKSEQTLQLTEGYTSHVPVMFLRVVSDFICQVRLILNLLTFSTVHSPHTYSTTHNTHSQLSMHTNIYMYTKLHRE